MAALNPASCDAAVFIISTVKFAICSEARAACISATKIANHMD
jgi:hypothetical protein